MLVGFANGCFDAFHEGHAHFLRIMASQCVWCIVAVNSDRSVKALKGDGRPVDRRDIRMFNVHEYANCVIPFEGDPKPLLQAIKPDILFRGEDQVITDFERAMFDKDKIMVISRIPGHSTTEKLKTMI